MPRPRVREGPYKSNKWMVTLHATEPPEGELWSLSSWAASLATKLCNHMKTINVKAYVFQMEQGEDGVAAGGLEGLHAQVAIHLSSPCTMEMAKQKVTCEGFKVPHLEGHVTWKRIIKYCSKNESRVCGPFYEGVAQALLTPPDKSTFDPLKGKELYPWQQKVTTIVESEPDPRTIYWIWEAVGNTGKSAFTKSLLCGHLRVLLTGGAGKDAKFQVASYCTNVDSRGPEVVLFDLPRSSDGKYISWEALESIKNGCFYSSKYESCQVVMGIPHVIVFANQQPDESKLSADRWEIHEIRDNDLPWLKLPTDDETVYDLERPGAGAGAGAGSGWP